MVGRGEGEGGGTGKYNATGLSQNVLVGWMWPEVVI